MSNPSVIVYNMYYAKPGHADEVLETRREASQVRENLALPRGRILRQVDGDESLPYVLWECGFNNVAAHDEDMNGRGASAEFEAVRARMRQLVDRFERTVWVVEHCEPRGFKSHESGAVSVLNAYYPIAGRSEAVLAQRIHASEVRLLLGHAGGRVLRRVEPAPATGEELPEVLWQLDYPNSASRTAEAHAVTSTSEFRVVMENMRQLVERFRRGIWQVD